jgi:hypothetical protein
MLNSLFEALLQVWPISALVIVIALYLLFTGDKKKKK